MGARKSGGVEAWRRGSVEAWKRLDVEEGMSGGVRQVEDSSVSLLLHFYPLWGECRRRGTEESSTRLTSLLIHFFHVYTLPRLHASTPPRFHASTFPRLHSFTPPHFHAYTLPRLHSSTPPLFHVSTLPSDDRSSTQCFL